MITYFTSYKVNVNHRKYLLFNQFVFFLFDIYDKCLSLIYRISIQMRNLKAKSYRVLFSYVCSITCFSLIFFITLYFRMWYQDRLGSGDRQFGIHRRQKRQERNESHDRGQLRHAQGTYVESLVHITFKRNRFHFCWTIKHFITSDCDLKKINGESLTNWGMSGCELAWARCFSISTTCESKAIKQIRSWQLEFACPHHLWVY